MGFLEMIKMGPRMDKCCPPGPCCSWLTSCRGDAWRAGAWRVQGDEAQRGLKLAPDARRPPAKSSPGSSPPVKLGIVLWGRNAGPRPRVGAAHSAVAVRGARGPSGCPFPLPSPSPRVVTSLSSRFPPHNLYCSALKASHLIGVVPGEQDGCCPLALLRPFASRCVHPASSPCQTPLPALSTHPSLPTAALLFFFNISQH